MKRTTFSIIATLAIPLTAAAQSEIDPNHAFSWGENIGWMNWRHGAPNPGDGVLIFNTHLEGSIWCENIGWINVGPGGGPYANDPLDASTFGVNLDPNTCEFHGFAWGENVGWINFDGGALATPAQPARIASDCTFAGYAWGENVGWINLDDATHHPAMLRLGDVDGDCVVDLTDLGILLANYGTGTMRSKGDLNGDAMVDLTDLGLLLSNYGASCP